MHFDKHIVGVQEVNSSYYLNKNFKEVELNLEEDQKKIFKD